MPIQYVKMYKLKDSKIGPSENWWNMQIVQLARWRCFFSYCSSEKVGGGCRVKNNLRPSHTLSLSPGQVHAAGLRPIHLPSLSLSQWPAGEGKAGKGPTGQKSTLFAKERPQHEGWIEHSNTHTHTDGVDCFSFPDAICLPACRTQEWRKVCEREIVGPQGRWGDVFLLLYLK